MRAYVCLIRWVLLVLFGCTILKLAPNGELAHLSVAIWEKQVANVDEGTVQENVSQGPGVTPATVSHENEREAHEQKSKNRGFSFGAMGVWLVGIFCAYVSAR